MSITVVPASELLALDYNGFTINARPQDGYINATQMCKINKKEISHWFATDYFNRYKRSISLKLGIPSASLVIRVSEGFPAKNAYFIHPKLAIKLARWIDVDFEIWCDEHIETLLNTGRTYLSEEDARMISGYKQLEAIGLAPKSLVMSDPYVFIEGGEVLTDSERVASRFGRKHKEIIKSIQSRLKNADSNLDFYLENFRETTRTDRKGNKSVKYVLTMKGFLWFSLRFNGVKAEKVNREFLSAFLERTKEVENYALSAIYKTLNEKTKVVYVLLNPVQGIIKIGITENLERRVAQINCATGTEMSIVFSSVASSNAKNIERLAHDRFKSFRLNGEWFNLPMSDAIGWIEEQKFCLEGLI